MENQRENCETEIKIDYCNEESEKIQPNCDKPSQSFNGNNAENGVIKRRKEPIKSKKNVGRSASFCVAQDEVVSMCQTFEDLDFAISFIEDQVKELEVTSAKIKDHRPLDQDKSPCIEEVLTTVTETVGFLAKEKGRRQSLSVPSSLSLKNRSHSESDLQRLPILSSPPLKPPRLFRKNESAGTDPPRRLRVSMPCARAISPKPQLMSPVLEYPEDLNPFDGDDDDKQKEVREVKKLESSLDYKFLRQLSQTPRSKFETILEEDYPNALNPFGEATSEDKTASTRLAKSQSLTSLASYETSLPRRRRKKRQAPQPPINAKPRSISLIITPSTPPTPPS